jgi:hypothetical protein
MLPINMLHKYVRYNLYEWILKYSENGKLKKKPTFAQI